ATQRVCVPHSRKSSSVCAGTRVAAVAARHAKPARRMTSRVLLMAPPFLRMGSFALLRVLRETGPREISPASLFRAMGAERFSTKEAEMTTKRGERRRLLAAAGMTFALAAGFPARAFQIAPYTCPEKITNEIQISPPDGNLGGFFGQAAAVDGDVA